MIATSQQIDRIGLATGFVDVFARLRTLDEELRRSPLAHHVRAYDRCVPQQLLDRSLAEIGALDLAALRRLPAVGVVKLRNLLAVLRRIVDEPRLDNAFHGSETSDAPAAVGDTSEREWRRWCERIAAHSLDGVCLGWVVERLGDLPRTLWHEPLRSFHTLSLVQLRHRPLFGAKRVTTIVETMRRLAERVGDRELRRFATPQIGPERIAAVDAWVVDCLTGHFLPTPEPFVARMVVPLLEQLEFDLGTAARDVVSARVERHVTLKTPPATSLVEMRWSDRLSPSRRLQIHRDAAAALAVRWPRGVDAAAALIGGRVARSGRRRPWLSESLAVLFPAVRRVRPPFVAEVPADVRTAALPGT